MSTTSVLLDAWTARIRAASTVVEYEAAVKKDDSLSEQQSTLLLEEDFDETGHPLLFETAAEKCMDLLQEDRQEHNKGNGNLVMAFICFLDLFTRSSGRVGYELMQIQSVFDALYLGMLPRIKASGVALSLVGFIDGQDLDDNHVMSDAILSLLFELVESVRESQHLRQGILSIFASMSLSPNSASLLRHRESVLRLCAILVRAFALDSRPPGLITTGAIMATLYGLATQLDKKLDLVEKHPFIFHYSIVVKALTEAIPRIQDEDTAKNFASLINRLCRFKTFRDAFFHTKDCVKNYDEMKDRICEQLWEDGAWDGETDVLLESGFCSIVDGHIEDKWPARRRATLMLQEHAADADAGEQYREAVEQWLAVLDDDDAEGPLQDVYNDQYFRMTNAFRNFLEYHQGDLFTDDEYGDDEYQDSDDDDEEREAEGAFAEFMDSLPDDDDPEAAKSYRAQEAEFERELQALLARERAAGRGPNPNPRPIARAGMGSSYPF